MRGEIGLAQALCLKETKGRVATPAGVRSLVPFFFMPP